MRLRLVLPLLALTGSGLLFVGLHLRGDGVLAAPHDPLSPTTVPEPGPDPSALVAPGAAGERARETGASAPRSAQGTRKTAWLEVVDPSGRPAAGVPVVRATEKLKSGWRSLGTSNPSGRLALPATKATDTGMVVAAKLGLGELRSAPLAIPHAALAAGEVTQLTLPLSVGLELRLVDSEGELLDVRGEAKLSVSRLWSKASLSGGRARFDGLLPDVELRAALQLGSKGPRFSQRVETPTTLGERRVVEFSIGVQTLIRARLLGDDGRPIVNSKFAARLRAKDANQEFELYRTDREGRCLFLVEGSPGAAPFSLDIQVRSLRGVTLAVRELELPRLPRGGLLSLGDIRTRDTDLLASGRVVDAAGEPVRDARVVVEVQVGEDGEWAPRSALDAHTSRGGSFVVRGVNGTRQLRLVARMSGHAASAPVLCRPGEGRVLLALRSLGSLHPTFEWSGGDLRQLLTLRLEHAGEYLISRRRRDWWGFKSLQPGPYDLSITLRGTDQPLLALHDLEVPFGGPCADARLHPIRLDGLLSVVRLTVVDSDGEPISDASAGLTDPVRASRVSATWRAGPEDAGRITVPTASVSLSGNSNRGAVCCPPAPSTGT